MNIAVAVSGGLDSLLSLVLLQEQGSQVMAVHGRFLDQDLSGPALECICRDLDTPFLELDLRREFEKRVIAPFASAYAAGYTPNPCAACNHDMKFGLLFGAAQERGAGRLATGHYVRLEQGRLLRGKDATKDQSYFLSLVPLERLERTVFPLGSLTKAVARVELARRGLTPPLTRESQKICFVPQDGYRAFLESLGLNLPGSGSVLLSDGQKIGRHRGLWRHTQGQRKGLGISWPEPLYVLDKDPDRNALVVGPAAELAAWGCTLGRVNRLAPQETWPATVLVQTRYRQKAKPARVELLDHSLELTFLEPQIRPTPGQIAALYTAEGQVLGGGIITAGQS